LRRRICPNLADAEEQEQSSRLAGDSSRLEEDVREHVRSEKAAEND
jgi:hypothetical protein